MSVSTAASTKTLQAIEQFNSGIISAEKLKSILAGYDLVNKQMKNQIAVAALSARYGKQGEKATKKYLEDTGYVGGSDNEVQAEQKVEDQLISCPELEMQITAAKCLDLSGKAVNKEHCDGCYNFKRVRMALLDDNDHPKSLGSIDC